MNDLKLVVFDVDGTLVDSQADIVASMQAAFERVGRPAPHLSEILSIVGLSLPQAMAVLAADVAEGDRAGMVEAYKARYMALRDASGETQSSPLYPHVRGVLERLHAIPDVLLGLATGKSRRGLGKLVEAHALAPFFVTQQCADDHPSKPHPAMLHAALAEVAAPARAAVMVGDTSYDMEMARAAGLVAIGVTWGYHPPERLSDAHAVIDDIRLLPGLLQQIWDQS